MKKRMEIQMKVILDPLITLDSVNLKSATNIQIFASVF